MDTNLTYCEDLIDITRCDSPSILQVLELNTQNQCTNVVDEVFMNNEELVKSDSQSTFCETPNDEINMSPNVDVNKEKQNIQNIQDHCFEVNADRYTHISQSQDNFIISSKFIVPKSKENESQEAYSIEDEIPFSVISTKIINSKRKHVIKRRTSKRLKELQKHKYFLRPKKEKKYNITTRTKVGKNKKGKKRNLRKKVDEKETVNNEDTVIIEDEIPLINNKRNMKEKTNIKKERKRKNKSQNTEESNSKVSIKTKTSHEIELPDKKTATKNKRKSKQIQESDNEIIDLTGSKLPDKLHRNKKIKLKNKVQELKENKDKVDVGNNKSPELDPSTVTSSTKLKKAGRKNKEQKKPDNDIIDVYNSSVLKPSTEICSSNSKNKLKSKTRSKKIVEVKKKLNLKNKIIRELEPPTEILSSNQKKPVAKGKRGRKPKVQIIEESNEETNVKNKTSHKIELPSKLLSNNKKIETNNQKRKEIQKIQESNKINVETNISELEYNDPENNIISSQNIYIVREMNVTNNSTVDLDFSDFLPDSPFLTDRDFETTDLKKLEDLIAFSQNSNSYNEHEYFSQPHQDFTFNNFTDTNFNETNRNMYIENNIIDEVEINDNFIKNNTANVNSSELTLDIPLSLDLDTIDLVESNDEICFSQNFLSLSELENLTKQDFNDKSKDTHFNKAKTLVNDNNNIIDECNINKAKSINLSIEITNSNVTNVATQRKVRVLKETQDFTESQVENITFKVLEELSNVKNYLNRRERTLESSGSRYSRFGTFSSGSQNSNSINESAYCLLQHITSSALVTHTEHITRQISIVLGNLIDKLHEEENYPNFLEKLLESVDHLLNYIYTGDNYEEYMLLKKEQTINRFFLLNRSSHIIQYSIQKITKILQETLEYIKLGDFELKHTDRAENIPHIFNILEILLNRHTKLRKNLSQHSSQMSQDDRVVKKSALTEIWRKKWNLSKGDVCEGSSQNNNFLIECSDVLNKITIEAMEGYSLISFAALQCYNLLQ